MCIRDSFQTDSLRHESVLNFELGSYPLRWIVSTGSIYHRDYASLADLARERVVTFSKHSRPHQDVLGPVSYTHLDVYKRQQLLNIVASGRVNLGPLVSHEYRLDDIVAAYDLFANQRDNVLKVAIKPH